MSQGVWYQSGNLSAAFRLPFLTSKIVQQAVTLKEIAGVKRFVT